MAHYHYSNSSASAEAERKAAEGAERIAAEKRNSKKCAEVSAKKEKGKIDAIIMNSRHFWKSFFQKILFVRIYIYIKEHVACSKKTKIVSLKQIKAQGRNIYQQKASKETERQKSSDPRMHSRVEQRKGSSIGAIRLKHEKPLGN